MRLCSLVLFLFPALAAAQRDWQGEWGTYTGPHVEEGHRLTIQDCLQQSGVYSWKFSLDARGPGGSAGTSGVQTLTLDSPTSAAAM